MIYLDHNASTPLRGEVLEAMLPFLRAQHGNPSSIHRCGQRARRAIDRARGQVAELIGASAPEIVFTSGGTEADNLALRSQVRRPLGRSHLITSAVEHPAILETSQDLERRGLPVSYLPVDRFGRVDPSSVEERLTHATALVSVMLANNDVGTLQPVEQISMHARERGVLMHTDAVQAAGKIPVNVSTLGVDLLSLSAHKIGGPKGCGALYVRRGVELEPLLTGGAHERGRRAGTENVPGIVGFGHACELARADLERDAIHVGALRDRLQLGLLGSLEGVTVNGHPDLRLPGTLNLSFPSMDGETLLMNLDILGFAVSTGSACSSGTVEPSHVLTAMGADEGQARGSIRLSLGPDNTAEEMDAAAAAICKVISTRGS